MFRRKRPRDRGGERGYAVVDAMVALMILSVAAILSFRAVETARQAAASAWEVRRAQALLSHLMDTGPRTYTPSAGERDGFRWRLETSITAADRPVEICRRTVSLSHLRTRRTYDAATLETCPSEAAPGA